MHRFIFPALLFVLSLGLLVFARLNVPWQGFVYTLECRLAEGHDTTDPHCTNMVRGYHDVHRGENLETNANEWRSLAYAPGDTKDYDQTPPVITEIRLAENTSLTLTDASTSPPTLALREGRVVISGPAKVTVRDTAINVTGKTSLVFYPWLDKLDVAHLETGESYTLDTLHPDSPRVETTFNPNTSSANSFYKWALGTTTD